MNGDFAKEANVTKVKILDEAKTVSTDFGEKLQCTVQCNDSVKSKRLWSINGTSQNSLIDAFGPDTKDWIGKEVTIEVVKTSTNTGMKNVVFAQM